MQRFVLFFILSLSFVIIQSSYAITLSKENTAKVQFLNKVTGKAENISLEIDKTYTFDERLSILLRACYKSSAQEEPENIAFLQVVRKTNENEKLKTQTNIPIPSDFSLEYFSGYNYTMIFSGWVFSSSPSVSHLVDPIYDITLTTCLSQD